MGFQYSTLDTEKSNLDTLSIDEYDAMNIVTCINNQDKQIAFAVEKVLPQIAQAVDVIEKNFLNGGRLIYVGAGTSGRLGVLDASECPPTFGTPPQLIQAYIAGGDAALRTAIEGCEDNGADGQRLMKELEIGAHDTVVGLSASGSAAYVIDAIRQAHNQGASTIGVITNANSILEKHCDIAIVPLVGPEPILGSTRMKSGTAQKMVLNMLSTASMIRMGKVYGNLMVDVQANNKKLEDRAIRIVMQATELDRETCEQALLAANKKAKTAILMLKTGKNAEQAEMCLAQSGGHLKKALQNQSKRF